MKIFTEQIRTNTNVFLWRLSLYAEKKMHLNNVCIWVLYANEGKIIIFFFLFQTFFLRKAEMKTDMYSKRVFFHCPFLLGWRVFKLKSLWFRRKLR